MKRSFGLVLRVCLMANVQNRLSLRKSNTWRSLAEAYLASATLIHEQCILLHDFEMAIG